MGQGEPFAVEYDRRKDTRHKVQMPATIVHIEREPLVTEDVSYRGVLLRASTPLSLGHVHKLEIRPVGEDPITLDGVPLWVREGAYGDADAVAMRLIGSAEPWERFIAGLQIGSVRRLRAHPQEERLVATLRKLARAM
jgi:hypothetical protein